MTSTQGEPLMLPPSSPACACVRVHSCAPRRVLQGAKRRFFWHARMPPRFVSVCPCSFPPSTALQQQNRLQRSLTLPQHNNRQHPLALPQKNKHQRPLLRAERTHAKTEETERTGQQVRRRKSGSMTGNTGKQGGAGHYRRHKQDKR